MNLRIGLSRRNFVTGAAASAVIATPRISAAAGPTIRVQPDNDLQDIPLRIRLSGFSPRQPVMVTAEMVTRDHFRWRSAAMFVIDADGEVDVGTTAAVGGSYSGVSPMGLIWSMERIGRPESEAPTTSVRLPMTVTFRAEARNGERAEASVIRALVGPGVTSKPLAEDGLLGVWFLPPGDGPHPAVIVLGGSEGGLPVRSAAPMLASHGYATLALAYFGLPGLPRGLVNIPLEYFGRAIAHLRATIAPRNDFVAVHGGSRGGELALLVASLDADIRAVVAVAPSGVVSGAFGPSEFGDRRPTGAWTLGGKLVPGMWQNNRYNNWFADPLQSPIKGTPRVLNAMRDLDAMERATIPVERIKGPVLMVSGRDDQLWPSFELAEIARRRLEAHNHSWPFEHISYPDAGHAIAPPYAPTTAATSVHPVNRQTYALGGTPKGQIEANVAYWRRTLDFLAEAEARAR
jgi:dienelactone hydrolase